MNCSQILPGAVNSGPCSLATGYFSGNPFVVYASGKDVILLDGHLQHLQTIFGSTRGYGDTDVSCLHCAEAVGKIAVAWETDIVIFEPSFSEELASSNGRGESVNKEFLAEWNGAHTLSLDHKVTSICWNRSGTCLLTGGTSLILWEYNPPLLNLDEISSEVELNKGEGQEDAGGRGEEEEREKRSPLKELWRCEVSNPLFHLKFSPSGDLFASCGKDDCLVKIWYPCAMGSEHVGIGQPATYSFCYVAHPQSVRGFVWRRITPSLPRGCIPNVLLTHCTDNICRLWSHSIPFNKDGHLRFFIAASIDPVADIPFRTTMPLDEQPFIVHWLNNKETTLNSKVEKYQKGILLPISHVSSLQSFTSNINEEILQSWVCIDDGEEAEDVNDSKTGTVSDSKTGIGSGSKSEQELSNVVSSLARKTISMYTFSNYLTPHSGERPSSVGANSPSPLGGTPRPKIPVSHKRALAHLLDEWCSTPDLLLCIHPTVGSLMVWTVEGLDAPPNLERLVHISFSSCLPHVFPPHLSQSLQQDLLQFLIKEPDALHTREANAEGGGGKSVPTRTTADINIPVPQIRLSVGASMLAMSMSHLETAEDVVKVKADSTLILVSSHTNGSLNTWSVELTVQSNFCTSIAGLIHCAGTGGHRSRVMAIHRHPWLPILMTVSSKCRPLPLTGSLGEEEDKDGVKVSELIIWNADLPGPLQHKSKLNELSRIVAPDTESFNHVTWMPPISIGGPNEGALARCPLSGLFVANVGKELILFQASLYSITKPQPSSFMQSDKAKDKLNKELSHTSVGHMIQGIKVTSQLGMKGITLIDTIESNLSCFEEIIGLHAFRMCSLVTTLDLRNCFDAKFSKDVILVLIENKRPQNSSRLSSGSPLNSPGSKGTRSFIHLWRLTLKRKPTRPGTPPFSASPEHDDHLQADTYSASITKVFTGPIPLSTGTHVLDISPACDISSSLQLQTPTFSAPFLFSTSCSDGSVQCWQISIECRDIPISPDDPTYSSESEEPTDNMVFNIYEVFDSSTRISDQKLKPSFLDCYEEEVIKSLPTQSFIPSGIKVAYPGCLAMAHVLSKPIKSSIHRNSVTTKRPSRSSLVKGDNPLNRYSMVTVWECESSGGLKWSCEATLMLMGLAQVSGSKSKDLEMNVLMEWIPMENGAYLLATCFASTLSIFGMSLPQDEEQFTVLSKRVGFLPKEKTSVLNKVKSQASWVCLLQFPCFRPSLDLSITCLSYTGSNSIMVTMGSEIHLYSCWVKGNQLIAFTPSKSERKKISKGPFSRGFAATGSPDQSNLAETDVNLLDYAHARNTPLPQYHPKILMELMNSGKLHAVKAILINLTKFLLLYREKKSSSKDEGTENYFDNDDLNRMYEDEPPEKKNTLILSADGYLERSKSAKAKVVVETIPHLPLSKMDITQSKGVTRPSDQPDGGEVPDATKDDYDELFSMATVTNMDDPLKFGIDEEAEVEVVFTDLDAEKGEFTPKLAKLLVTILNDHQLADLSDLEQVQLQSITETMASTKLSIGDLSPSEGVSLDTPSIGLSMSSLSGAGYASSGGSKGREAMDDCGLRYLIALESHITLSKSLPSDVSPGPLPPSVLVWAFHSDAETDLLSAIPSVQKDELKWEELRKAGIGWWLRSLDTLRRLMEKLAKAQFMRNQQPLDASLLYLAMKKQSLLKGLFKSVSDSRMTSFFANNFSNDRWKKAALKNAFALLGKQRFEEAAAFFLLADKLWDAVEVCVSRLSDFQLAFVIVRLYEGDHGPIYERFLKEYILGVPSSQYVDSKRQKTMRLEPNPDPFLRSMVFWLLQDFSGALETLLVDPEANKDGSKELQIFLTNPAIFNFYFYLRAHPFLIRRDHRANTSILMAQSSAIALSQKSSGKQSLSSVGDEPLTALERSLLFGTAYYHLCHGCPLLVLNVLSRLPKSSNLGADVCEATPSGSEEGDGGSGQDIPGGKSHLLKGGGSKMDSMTGMIESGTLEGAFGKSGAKRESKNDDDDFDWGAPASSQGGGGGRYGDMDDEIDWSKPMSRYDNLQNGNDDIDWSQPISSRMFSQDAPTLSPPHFNTSSDSEEPTRHRTSSPSPQAPPDTPTKSSSMLTTRGLFVLTLAEQLQYNACLSIFTEELHSIYLPACCLFLWQSKGTKGPPILPLSKQQASEVSLTLHYSSNAFDKTVQNLRGMLMDWLRGETQTVKEVCLLDLPEPDKEDVASTDKEGVASTNEVSLSLSSSSVPAGYDLLTTLMNYASLHAATSPSLLTVKFELMHLMNTLLPWGTGSLSHLQVQGRDTSSYKPNISLEFVPTCAVDPSQLPILTSCSLPVRHLTNLATHLRMLSKCIINVLSRHTYPPISSQPLPQINKIFELCSAISHCLTVSLNPFLSEVLPQAEVPDTPNSHFTSSVGSLGRTPTPSFPILSEMQQQRDSKLSQSPLLRPRIDSFSNLDYNVGSPNTKPAKWPGILNWPCTLTSDEGRDPTPLSVVLVECVVTVYLGLLATAWSQHSVEDLLVLLKNLPSMDIWYSTVGGGVEGRSSSRREVKSFVTQTIENVSKRFGWHKPTSPKEEEDVQGVFIAPRRTLLDHFLSVPIDEEERKKEVKSEPGFFMVGREEKDESEDEDDEDDVDDMYGDSKGIIFSVGGEKEESLSETTPRNPDCFAWCLINLCISKLTQQMVRKMVSGVGLEVLELVTVSPLLYSTLKILDEWESILTRRLEALGEPPDDLFGSDELSESSKFKIGLALMRHKFILEPENSPFQSKDKISRHCKRLWQFLVHQDEPRETIIQYIFMNKHNDITPAGSLDEDEPDVPQEPTCKIIHKEHDNTVSAFCLNSCSRAHVTVLALALPREVLEIEVPDNSLLDTMSTTEESSPRTTSPKRNMSRNDDYIMVQSTSHIQRPKSSIFPAARHSIANLPRLPTFSTPSSSSQLAHGQTGSNNSLLIKRPTAGVKRMAPHPSLAYYLTGSLDGSVTMWEFGIPRPVAMQRQPGMGGSVTKIRFTSEGNKFGVTDGSGKLSLWQGIQTSTRSAYHILHSCMRYLSDFLFLGSSSFIATCGDGDGRNLYLWDTLMPTNRSIVKEFVCHDGGATSLGYSLSKQKLFCGGKKGEVCIFDIRQFSLLHCISVHTSTINCIAVNDIDGYFVTGASDGDIKVIDSSTLRELAYFPGQHAKSRLFRHSEGGVTDLDILPGGKLYSCGADGSIKCQTLNL